MMPSVMAAIAGPMAAPAMPDIIREAAAISKAGAMKTAAQASDTPSATAASTARLARVASERVDRVQHRRGALGGQERNSEGRLRNCKPGRCQVSARRQPVHRDVVAEDAQQQLRCLPARRLQ